MVYFDNAATTYPKPPSVISAMSRAMVSYGGNPGRAGHKLSVETAEAVYKSRAKCAEFFGAEPENTVFTLNCTHALNLAIKGIMTRGSHVITSDIEHNAVIRPIHAAARESGAYYSIATTPASDYETVKSIERLINPRTKAVIVTAAGNVSGQLLPIKKIGALCKKRGLCLIVDTAQLAGVMPISLSDGINIICAAGHKGLYGPMGTGLMLTDGQFRLKTIIEGGTGSASKDIEQPEFLPDRFESGTINTAGAIALGAGIDFVREKTAERIYNHEMQLCRRFYEGVRSNKNVILYSDGINGAPLVPFNIKGADSADTASKLSAMGFYLRGGFHCSFLAHKKLGTLETGAVRFAPSVFSTGGEVAALVRAISHLS